MAAAVCGMSVARRRSPALPSRCHFTALLWQTALYLSCGGVVEKPGGLSGFLATHDAARTAAYWKHVANTERFYTENRHWTWRARLEAWQRNLQITEASGWDVTIWRDWLLACADAICTCNTPAQGGPQLSAMRMAAEPCSCEPLPATAGQVGRTLRLGRVLWCAAAASRADAAADFFAFTGGSATLLAHGLAMRPGARMNPATLWTWELWLEYASVAAWNLQVAGADAELVTPTFTPGAAARATLLAAARGGDPAASVRAVVVAAPPFDHGANASEAEAALIRTPCATGKGLEFVYLDPPGPFMPEFVSPVEACPNLKWVAVGHVNLERHAGWIARYLANVTGWYIVAHGEYEWEEVAFSERSVPTRRQWQLLARGDALRFAPPPLHEWLAMVHEINAAERERVPPLAEWRQQLFG
mmetsp:Transcript_1749/g.5524  ORF Transcript_1749/g.5524 Transcript_1749/m.5524 type:complete len:417 (-) Transcript_1749:100-1350(-)